MPVAEPMLESTFSEITVLQRLWHWMSSVLKRFWPVLAVAVHIIVGTLIWQHLLVDKVGADSSFEDAFYFSVVTFLTIGYGDLSPASDAGKIFFLLYCISSLVLQLTIVSELVSSTISFRPTDPEDLEGGPRRATVQTAFKVQPRIWKAAEGFALLFVLISTGAIMLQVTDGKEGRQLSWLDCWYWSFTTISTVGYGDIVPSHHRIYFALFFLVTVVLFAFLLGESVALLTETKRYTRMDKFFAKGLTPEILDAMDIFRDGQVSKVEFMMFILDRLELVGQDEMNRILEMFDEADTAGDGILNLQDTRNRLSGALGEGLLDGVDVDAIAMTGPMDSSTESQLRKGKGVSSRPPSAS